jgi:hypothetical protein
MPAIGMPFTGLPNTYELRADLTLSMAQIGEFKARLTMSSKNFSRPPGAPVFLGFAPVVPDRVQPRGAG